MQPNEYLRNKARKLAKQTWAGPGKFGVFIVICIIVIAFFESVGLSNREKNLELRNVHNIVMPTNYKIEKINEGVDQLKSQLVLSSQTQSIKIDSEKKNADRVNILLLGAMEQYLFEHKDEIDNYEKIETANEKKEKFVSLLIKEKDEIVNANAEDLFIFDI